MDWDRNSAVLWLAEDAEVPTASQFQHDVGAVKWNHAIEALRDIYRRQQEPVPPVRKPWMLWNDGTIFSPGQISAVRPIFDDEVTARGGALAKELP